MTDVSTNDVYATLRPAQKYVALESLKAGIEAEIKVQKAEALEVAQSVGVKSFDTDFGVVNIVTPDAPIDINEFELFDFVKENMPESIETVQRVPDWLVRQLSDTKSMKVVDGSVYDKDGTELPYAKVGTPKPAYVAWPASNAQKAGKAQAVSFIRDRANALSVSVLGLDNAIEVPAIEAAPAIVVIESEFNASPAVAEPDFMFTSDPTVAPAVAPAVVEPVFMTPVDPTVLAAVPVVAPDPLAEFMAAAPTPTEVLVEAATAAPDLTVARAF